MATSGGFATALFFATAVYPVGPLLGELKLGVIASGIGVVELDDEAIDAIGAVEHDLCPFQ